MIHLLEMLVFIFLLSSFGPFQYGFCKKKSLGNKSLKKLSKSEVQVKTYLFPCSIDKDILNSTFGPSKSHLHNCKRKLIIRMTVNSGGEYCSKTDGFIPISHVIDGITGRKKRLLNPFMVRLKREKMYQLYDLQLVKSVNAEAREEVINYENTPNYTGCDTSSSHPTCGFSFFNNKIIQFSEGFCCSCDQTKNDQRQPCESHSHESKDFPDMEYAVHRHSTRGNRTSRDLNPAEESLDTLRSSGSRQQQLIADRTVSAPGMRSSIPTSFREFNKRSESNGVQDTLNSTGPKALLVQTFEDLKPALSNDFWINNVTVKTFEFENSLDTNIEHSYSISPFNIVIDTERENSGKLEKQEEGLNYNTSVANKDESSKTVKLEDSAFDHLTGMEGDLNEYFDTFKNTGNVINPINRDKFKSFMKKRIKVNKNQEENTLAESFISNGTANQMSRKYTRDLKGNLNSTSLQEYDCLKNNKKNGFSLKLENNNSELMLRIITKKPKGNAEGRGASNVSVDHGVRKPLNASKKLFSKNNTLTDKESPEHTTVRGLKRIVPYSVLKYFKSDKNNKTTTVKNEKLLNVTCHKLVNISTTANVRKQIHDSKATTTTCKTPVLNNSQSLFFPLNNLTKLHTMDLNKMNISRNSTDLESLMYKLVPVINTVHNLKTTGSEGFKNADGIVADTDNTTYKVYIELKKKSDGPGDKTMNIPHKKHSLVDLENQVNTLDLQLPGELNHKSDENRLDEESLFPRTPLAEDTVRPSYLYENQPHENLVQNIQKREATCNSQIRGGQRCSTEGSVPCNSNPETYFESAHCLRFSDLWFNVFKLLNPRLENSITVKVYAKHKTPDKRICWENLSKRLPGRVGTVNEVLTDEAESVIITYSSDDKVAYNLDCVTDYVLVPQPLPRYCKDAELKILGYGGPEEYLVLKENEITFDGEECDKAGVNYAAFARQLHRCQQEAGSCLRNQPLHYWRKDKEATKNGKQGQYFLKNFIEVTDQAILQNTTSNQVVLRAPYFERYTSQVVLEMNADHIEIIGDKTEGQITEVYTDATSDKVTIVRAVVTNLGIASDFFGVDFANCSSRLGPSDFDKPGKDEIPPQHRITYTATVSSPLKSRRVECKMVLYNLDQEVVASRNIIIVQGQRCMCVWYCQCVCYNHPHPGLPCNPLTVRDYNRAGFPGHLPVTIGSDCSTLFTVLHALLWFFLFLLLFGLIKAILGLCFSMIGLWGLWYLLPDEARCLQVYLEPENACCPVVRDCDGFPIHPRSYRRTQVHFLPWYSEFIVNVFFFICVFRSCLCDHGSYRGSVTGFYNQGPCYPRTRNRTRCCSPNCSVRQRSPCGSICSNRRNRKFRISAGGEEEFLNPDPQLMKDDEWAKRLVDELTQSYIVFRVLTRPLGGVKCVPGTPYCVRGFFLESENGVYEFNPPSPLMQIRQLDGTPLDPPVMLDPAPFHVLYHSAREVLGAHELSPWARGVVINAPY